MMLCTTNMWTWWSQESLTQPRYTPHHPLSVQGHVSTTTCPYFTDLLYMLRVSVTLSFCYDIALCMLSSSNFVGDVMMMSVRRNQTQRCFIEFTGWRQRVWSLMSAIALLIVVLMVLVFCSRLLYNVHIASPSSHSHRGHIRRSSVAVGSITAGATEFMPVTLLHTYQFSRFCHYQVQQDV